MDAIFLRSARYTLLAGTMTLGSLCSVTLCAQRALGLDHPVPSDTSTRKGVAAPDKGTSDQETSLDEFKPADAIRTEVKKTPKANTPPTNARTEASANVSLAQWVADWMKNPRKVTAKLAIHGVVPEIELEAVLPAAQQKICANGKCYEVDEKTVEAKACDEPNGADANTVQEEQISEAPVAPPIPPSFPFAIQSNDQDRSVLELQFDEYQIADEQMETVPYGQDAYGSLGNVQVSIPASMLIAYMVAHAENTVRLEMTEQLAAERAMYAQRYELLLHQNQQLQTQLAVLEARQQSSEALATRATGRPMAVRSIAEVPPVIEQNEEKRCLSLTATREDWDAIQEDLSNIRRQIAILKNASPIPFAPSNIGNETKNSSRQPQAWRTARSIPYTPVFPSPGKSPETTQK